MDRFREYFSFQGRANRQPYWLTNLVLILILALGALLIGALAARLPVLGIIAIPAFVGFFWAGLAIAARRLHDRDKSAWWLVLFQGAPILLGAIQGALEGAGGAAGGTGAAAVSILSLPISIWAFVELGCLRGTVGPNRFGPDPLAPFEDVFA